MSAKCLEEVNQMTNKKKFQPIVSTDLTPEEFEDLKLLTRLQDKTITAFVGNLIRIELEKRKYMIRANRPQANAHTSLENSSSSPAAAPPNPSPETLPFANFQ